ncbi:MAG: type I DNA topoisomerase [Ilumatobacter sp.]|uniref:type I DNA topoisomerase n=1 Tax=Ilumatobacter sp. TaxID=1967498 RepID=UPI002630FCBB|nr:type I DNA topoisomerase [Ilumatobacter sp.]MDJ0770320.1 type I DNA topoisomerase [Ilumatobacter sp.]
MSKPLVVVESPAKAKTISKFLGSDFDVRASVGHVADLPSKGLNIDVDNGFKPTYELTDRGKQVVKDLKSALKEASELYLATDEDREGEAISWHLVEYLKPKVPVKRMVFHEITKAAIDHAIDNPRGIDYGLVDAAETRRLLDRLYGYEVSPVLWRRVNRGLSAGRVQSPSIRLIVERERERIAFVSADYWDIDLLTATAPAFDARLVAVDGTRVASGKDFDDRGQVNAKTVAIDEPRARALATGLEDATFSVRSVDEKPYRSSPKAPFMTSTLQQEGGRKLRLSSSQVMRVAQGLYERGYITYMRTDSVTLSDEAMKATRAAIASEYGSNHLSPQPKVYTSKSKNAQEAHEAVRPTTPYRSPKQLEGELNSQDLSLYRLIWQRTLASQMADATGVTVSVRLGSVSAHEQTDCEFNASGTTITFPGYRAVYVASDDAGPDGDGSKEALLPPLAAGEIVPVASLTPNGHTTSPPARYTEASLVKRLEELEIGRPSTWASIIQTIQDRGYVWKKGQALVPTWTAFAVVGLLEQHFGDLVDYELTAKMDADLDEIANGTQQKDEWLTRFYFGDDDALPGLKRIVEENLDKIDAAEINTFPLGHDDDGELIVAKPGKYGPYVKRGEDTASVPEDLPPDELDVAKALELLAMPKSDEPIGQLDGHPVYAKNGRYGPYVQWGDPDDLPAGLEKPKMSSLFQTMTLDRITLDDAEKLLMLPRSLGNDPVDGKEIVANNGRYGPYVVKEKDFRSIDSEEQLLTITLDQASKIFQLPKVFKRGGRNMAAKGPLREFGTDPVSERPVVAKDGRFGVYVTDGETNASIGKGDRIEEITPARAFELLAIRREVVAAKGGPAKKTRKKAAPKKAAAKKSSAKKSAAKEPGAEQAG